MQTNAPSVSKYKSIIRKYMRSLRHSITLSEQYVAAQLITNKILTLSCIQQATNIAIFISFDGEIRTDLLIQYFLCMNKHVYLPVLPTLQSQCLSFVRYNLSTLLIRNRFNIYEPKYNVTSILPIEKFDIIFIPLVAFDKHCNRLGMGGGFYDKTLNYCQKKLNCIYIGLGYDFQRISTKIFPINKKDVKLSKIVTPYHTYINI